ncbi:putative late blight resistance protein homolog R1A-4 [Salvia miltiorrhiza]|uniref:putative late blight resistance protein homolog R1A-4 n=1 Tax=Salvia miltiorrhiza TaxID=226208 RepID=UPI0025ABE617|nr:putative late blight resistance protein homolog R1A-4 [Salvia miltiorrhiza]
MAYAALLSALQALRKATQQDHLYNLSTIKHQITILDEKLCFLQDFLENDPPAGGIATDSLEGRIREAAYQAEDIVDFHVQNPLVPVTVRRSIYQDFQNVVDEVVSIVQQVVVIKESRKEIKALQLSDHTYGDAPIGKTAMVGFDDELMEIKNQLCGGSTNVKVVSLVGMAGIGKTTLATNVFCDPCVEYHFHVRAWTAVTQDHRRSNILRGLLHSMAENSSPGSEQVDELVYKSLKGRRYLVVLDDMWSTEAWDDVKMIFPDDHNGSRILVTTRLVDVAVYANSSAPFHQMRFLNEEQSWELLRGKVFGEERRCPRELEETGRWIARNCRGLPLSIIVVAGLLKVDRRKHQWENIGRDVSLAVTASRDEEEHLPTEILSLSYNHLPHHLKPCFLSMGGFPEDYQIPVFELIAMWVAEGFLRPIRSKSLELVAEAYLEDLVKRSLVLVTMNRSNGKPRFCSIHDLLRDLCIKRGRFERFLHPMNGIQESMKQKRRLWFSKCVEWFHFRNACSSPARSVFCCSYNDEVLIGFSHLKILHILEVNFEYFPIHILQFLHLKFLAFASGFIRYSTLPPSLPKLENLQSLIVGSSVKFSSHEYRLVVPLPIWEMPQLRHLVFLNITLSPASFLSPVLENLQTLSRVRNFSFTREAIERIPNLKRLKGSECRSGLRN